MSSGFITTPLDAVKTRYQVLSGQQNSGGGGKGTLTITSVATDIYQKHGIKGYFRGVLPRMASVSLWGTTMVSLFEALKRSAANETERLKHDEDEAE